MLTPFNRIFRAVAALTTAGLLASSAAQAAVSLQFNGGTLAVAPGGTLEIDLFLEITGGEQVAGIDYYWQAESEAAGFLSLIGRDISGSPISILYYENSEVLVGPGNVLDPENAFDLGGITEDAFVSNGSWLVATYTIEVSALLTPGTYQITTYAPPGFGWATPAPGSQIFAFAQQAEVVFTVVPEPTSGLLLVTGLTVFGRIAFGRRSNKKS